ncbi:hypothetical protein RclHR1_00010066 [Rhizophagus clarus]|uniref:Uncharacterized protein n=1 Tax=Rhizophagus clarus TaxID=94130 RepID=A0A2Z6QEA9_9GLOM|nr:hypothetical protein RclHR1_00010066 [Rhizophagus clarus]GES75134.1 hypothetical protein RCL_e4244_RclHR1_00010066 [Rhizophagus clarus]
MLFSYPPLYEQWYCFSDVLICKICFRELTEEYFGDVEMQYLEILKETTEMEMSQDEHFPPGIGWKYDEKEEYEI